ncbi:zinc ABC transporter ATP-binding protein ZnuC [Motiliproteus sp. MSK22-1]|uniref:zinc ABC transporter ATP-binding protein ZnuC n=1 Tax=Motiliproteus sp. MSK22-1 TaxID=1897630 RepID=UPI0009766A5A|nr:zinc ABC transporter ATP-binding protein ZnuC [Motiliproteus sp. MSK22-1]OMH39480.1 zinc ABC transporter ATP-binding protein ZnuC [Motiliproteus sp. MSK22-1]
MTNSAFIQLQNVNLHFGNRHVIQNVSFDIESNQITTLIGPNGSGKSTLVRILLGLQLPDSGTIGKPDRLRIGYMPQKLHIEPTLPLTVERFMKLAARATSAEILGALKEVNVEHLLKNPMQKLSGGETQRVMLARALLRQPQLLVLDEPVQGVDITGQIELYELIAQIRDRHQCAVFMVSHDLHMVMASTDKVICLNHHICCSGHPEIVSNDPSFIALFGRDGASNLALYSHHHNHQHDAHGQVIMDHPCVESTESPPESQQQLSAPSKQQQGDRHHG